MTIATDQELFPEEQDNILKNEEKLSLSQYQEKIELTWIENEFDLQRILCGLSEESGEILGKFKKYFRGDYGFPKLRELAKKEIGDLFYYLAKICNFFNIEIEDVLAENINKLQDRKKRGTLKGNGDLR